MAAASTIEGERNCGPSSILLIPPTLCPQKTTHICFCQNFIKFPPILIIFGRKMGNDPNICEVHSFSTSPNLRHHLTVLNANVPNCYITPKLLVINRSHWRPQFKITGHFGTIRILGNSYIFDK